MKSSRLSDGRWLIDSHLADAYGHWAHTRAAAMGAAARCGVNVAEHEVLKRPLSIAVVAPMASGIAEGKAAGGSRLKCKFDEEGAKKGFEEEGGPGLQSCFDFIDASSSAPIADVHALLRWTIASYILGHTEQHAGHVVLEDLGQGFRLAPFAWMTVFPGSASATRYPLAKGFRLGTAWPDEHLRVDGWIKLAKWARVHPKIVFAMAKDMAHAIPVELKAQLEIQYDGELVLNTPSRVLELVRKRAQRLLEVHMTAPSQGIAGVKRAPVMVTPAAPLPTPPIAPMRDDWEWE